MTDEVKSKLGHIGWRLKNVLWRAQNYIRDNGGKVLDYIQENPTEVIGGVTLVISGVKASRSLVVSHRKRQERKRIDRTYYDPSSGFHWQLKRKATNNDRIAITNRKRAGENVGDILKDLKLI